MLGISTLNNFDDMKMIFNTLPRSLCHAYWLGRMYYGLWRVAIPFIALEGLEAPTVKLYRHVVWGLHFATPTFEGSNVCALAKRGNLPRA